MHAAEMMPLCFIILFTLIAIIRTLILLNLFLHLILVSFLAVAADEVTQEACHEELCAQNHRCERNVEIRAVGHQRMRLVVAQRNQLVCSHAHHGDEANNEHERADEAEDVHRLHAKTACFRRADDI